MASMPHVALLIETSRSYGRELLRGVRRYIEHSRPWSVFIELRSLDSQVPPWLKKWRGDGILARTSSQAMARAIQQSRVPVVELRSTRLHLDCPFVGVDNRALGKNIADHFLQRGYRSFGVYDMDSEDYFEQRRDDFVRSLKRAGFTCSVYHADRGRERPSEWERQQSELARWASSLPKPAGVMACTDQLGFWLLDACKRSGISVPEEVAVVGVENDETLCEMATPPLSSVPLGGEQVGYEAASVLDRLMRGYRPPRKPILLSPPDIVVRQSSDIVAVQDDELVLALRYIREHACAGANVSDLLKTVPISRSSLERKMRVVLGRTPHSEFNRVRLERVKQLLARTDLALAQIAPQAGFQYPQYMSELFKRTFGTTPGRYRAACRGWT